MEHLRARPLFSFCALFLVASAAVSGAPAILKLILSSLFFASGVASAVLFAKKKDRRFVSALILSAAVALSSALSFVSFNVALARAEKYDCSTVACTVKIEEERYSSENFGVYRARLTADETGDRFSVVLTTREGCYLPGDVLTGDVVLSRLLDEGAYDERSAELPDLVFMEAEDSGLVFSHHDGSFSLRAAISSVRGNIRSRFSSTLSSPAAGLSSALLIGERGDLDPAIKKDFARLGVSHLLAISGLHLSVILFMVGKALGAFRVRRIPGAIVTVVFIAAFAALAGFTASIVRASVMHVIGTVADAAGKRRDPLTSLGVAGALIVIADPFAVVDAALWLSLLSAFACVAPSVRKKETPAARSLPARLLRYAVSSVKLTLYITACTLPVTWLVFGEASVVSPLSNLIGIPVITVYLWATVVFAVLLSAGIVPSFFTSFMNSFARGISSSASFFSGARGIVRSVRGPVTGAIIIVLFISALALPFISDKRRRLRAAAPASALCLVAAVAVTSIIRSFSSDAVFVTGKKSDGFAVRSGNEYALVDVSSGSNAFLRRLLFEGKKGGATEIGTYVLTHCHMKHASAVYKLTGLVTVRRVMIPEGVTDDERDAAETVADVCRSRGVECVVYGKEGAKILRGVSVVPLDAVKSGRSTHRVVSFSLDPGSSPAVYLGSSVADRTEEELSAVEKAASVTVGSHPNPRVLPELPGDAPVFAAPGYGDLPERVFSVGTGADGFGSERIPFGK
ncbi:MAG: ComEC/Rec2 family competence protein [Clostridia bacterium]|nr:ComEC/Rec2 family competence protein [Clostridia bacterium]